MQVVSGSSGQLTPRGSMAWQDFTAMQDDELDSIHDTTSIPPSARSPVDPIRDFARNNSPSTATASPKHRAHGDNDLLKLAARTVSQYMFS